MELCLIAKKNELYYLLIDNSYSLWESN